jgi:hypothetical protein
MLILFFLEEVRMKKSVLVNVVVMVLVALFSNAASANLLAHWSFDTDFTDVSSNSFDLTAVNGAGIVSGGRIGGAASFSSASNQYASVAFTENAMFDPSEDYTVMAWYYLDVADITAGTGGPRYQVFESGGNYTASYALRDLSTDTLGDIGQIYTQNTSGAASNTTFSPGANQQWHHIAVTFDHLTGIFNAYVDGAFAGTMTRSGTLKPSSSFFVGEYRNPSSSPRAWEGLIDDVAVFDNIVSTSDIQHYAQGYAVPEPATVCLLALGSLLFTRRNSK